MTTVSSSFSQAFITFLEEMSKLAEWREGESITSVKISSTLGNGSWIVMAKTTRYRWTWIISSQSGKLLLVENGPLQGTGNMIPELYHLTGPPSDKDLQLFTTDDLFVLCRTLVDVICSRFRTIVSSAGRPESPSGSGTATPA